MTRPILSQRALADLTDFGMKGATDVIVDHAVAGYLSRGERNNGPVTLDRVRDEIRAEVERRLSEGA